MSEQQHIPPEHGTLVDFWATRTLTVIRDFRAERDVWEAQNKALEGRVEALEARVNPEAQNTPQNQQ